MSTYVLMRILESSPRRYDFGIWLLTLGRVGRVYDQLITQVGRGQRVLDLGCGTGALTLRAARRGALVKSIDVNSRLLEIAAKRAQRAGMADRVELVEMGVAELDQEATASFDVVTSGLCLSELSRDELTYTLEQVARILKPGGLFLIADEIRPTSWLARGVRWLVRAPLATLTYLVTQQTTHALADLPGRLARAGLAVVSVRSRWFGGLSELVARRPAGGLP